MTALVCLCTCPNVDVATQIADTLVSERLAACVSAMPNVSSVFRWEGKVQRASEVLLLIKTQREHLSALTQRIVELHVYDVPEVIALDVIGGYAPYLEWIAQQTQQGPHA